MKAPRHGTPPYRSWRAQWPQKRSFLPRPKLSIQRLLCLSQPPTRYDKPLHVHFRYTDVSGEINQRGVTILLVEQNARAALQVAHRGYVLETGKVVLSGAAKELLRDERVRKAYLGEQ